MSAKDYSDIQASRHLTRKGLETRQSLIKAAQEAFMARGYYASSVSEITRLCGVSQGAFYQYFRNKEQIFLEINDAIIRRFWVKAHNLSLDHDDFDERLRQVLLLMFNHTSENLYFHRILGEFELIDPITIGYYDSIARLLRDFFRREAGLGSVRPLDPNLLAYALMGIVYFHSLDWGEDADSYPGDMLVDLTIAFIRKGISGPKPWTKPKDMSASSFPGRMDRILEPQESLTQGQMTERAIFRASEEVFGKYGFNHAGISEITRLAGVAQGTFYIYFKSKRDLLEKFVKYLSREIRRAIKLATEGAEDRRDTEREGMLAFFRFLRVHSQIYRVVAESETLGPEVGMWYYKKLAEGYSTGVREGIEKGEIREMPVAFAVRSLMGLYHMIGLKWLVWKSFPHVELPKMLLADAAEFVMGGLDP